MEIIKVDANEEIFRGWSLIYWLQRTGTAWRNFNSSQSASQTLANFPLDWGPANFNEIAQSLEINENAVAA